MSNPNDDKAEVTTREKVSDKEDKSFVVLGEIQSDSFCLAKTELRLYRRPDVIKFVFFQKDYIDRLVMTMRIDTCRRTCRRPELKSKLSGNDKSTECSIDYSSEMLTNLRDLFAAFTDGGYIKNEFNPLIFDPFMKGVAMDILSNAEDFDEYEKAVCSIISFAANVLFEVGMYDRDGHADKTENRDVYKESVRSFTDFAMDILAEAENFDSYKMEGIHRIFYGFAMEIIHAYIINNSIKNSIKISRTEEAIVDTIERARSGVDVLSTAFTKISNCIRGITQAPFLDRAVRPIHDTVTIELYGQLDEVISKFEEHISLLPALPAQPGLPATREKVAEILLTDTQLPEALVELTCDMRFGSSQG